MRSSFTARTGLILIRSPNQRHLAARRRLLAICTVLGLALASGLIGSMTAPGAHILAQAKTTGPFSYLPAQ